MWTKAANVNVAQINRKKNGKKYRTMTSKCVKKNEPERNEIFEQHKYFAFVNYVFHNETQFLISKNKSFNNM